MARDPASHHRAARTMATVAGIGTTCWRELRVHGAKGLGLIADRTPVMATYRWARIHDLLPIFRSQAEALQEMGEREDDGAA